MQTYTVTIRTSCERCAIAVAGHAPALKTVRSAMVTTEREDGSVVTIHSNHPRLKAHDGSPLACPEHGIIVDLAREPHPSVPRALPAGASLLPVQQARRVDGTAHALRLILDAARADRETALLVHAVASAEERDDALRSAVAASAAVDVAFDALTSYVVHGLSQRREMVEADDDPLHERCRIARNAVARQVRDVFAGRPS